MVAFDKTWLAEKIIECQQGDEATRKKTCEELAERLLPHIIKAVRRELRRSEVDDHTTIEDLVSDVFLIFFTKFDTLRPETVLGWLRVVIRHRIWQVYRYGFNAREQTAAAPWMTNEELYYNQVSALAEIKMLHDALMALPKQSRRLLFDLYWKDLPPKTVALKEGIGEHAVYSRHKKALRLLRIYLAEQGCITSYSQTDIGCD